MAGAGKPVGLAIAGLGMAGAVMVRAAAAHPGVSYRCRRGGLLRATQRLLPAISTSAVYD